MGFKEGIKSEIKELKKRNQSLSFFKKEIKDICRLLNEATQDQKNDFEDIRDSIIELVEDVVAVETVFGKRAWEGIDRGLVMKIAKKATVAFGELVEEHPSHVNKHYLSEVRNVVNNHHSLIQ